MPPTLPGIPLEAFDAGAVSYHCVGDELVPGFSGADFEKSSAVFIMAASLFDTLKGNFQQQARPASIGDQQVAAAAQNEQRQVARARKSSCLLHLTDIPGLDEMLRRASDLDGGQRGERDVFEQKHESFSNIHTTGSRRTGMGRNHSAARAGTSR